MVPFYSAIDGKKAGDTYEFRGKEGEDTGGFLKSAVGSRQVGSQQSAVGDLTQNPD